MENSSLHRNTYPASTNLHMLTRKRGRVKVPVCKSLSQPVFGHLICTTHTYFSDSLKNTFHLTSTSNKINTKSFRIFFKFQFSDSIEAQRFICRTKVWIQMRAPDPFVKVTCFSQFCLQQKQIQETKIKPSRKNRETLPTNHSQHILASSSIHCLPPNQTDKMHTHQPHDHKVIFLKNHCTRGTLSSALLNTNLSFGSNHCKFMSVLHHQMTLSKRVIWC